ncbi:free methionine-R-sulfoxide reductase [Komagataeibacter europaeus]|uniref:Free methionine-R-sulfoxide reductase n=1 Tax=Komagataeibacter europaeus TaxID=33995 RepID=A0A0M0EJZ8_KOMEU|nr:GAF domain-containing protein [Komagataeibacter europaeus]ARW15637.1 GAF domain-containing protein [Komagataeibacter europaeus]KON65276.1 free methionine-R-sulfoxide reductase [Komagataeibacter europaeus]
MTAPQKRLGAQELVAAVASVVANEPDMIADMANIAAMIFEALPDLNWAGFYIWKEGQLVLGPFQGRMACTRIAYGKGVCGTVARERRTIIVPDVHAFPGHIACDAASASEIVVPVIAGDRLLGVLDVDSPVRERFSDTDRIMLEKIVDLLVRAIPVGTA